MKKAAFKVGEVLRYTGSRKSWTVIDGKEVPFMYPGMFVTIIEVHQPSKGIGFIKTDEDGEPVIDHDRDGYNVCINTHGQKRLLWPDSKHEWMKAGNTNGKPI